jgi:hypothetical protein
VTPVPTGKAWHTSDVLRPDPARFFETHGSGRASQTAICKFILVGKTGLVRL